MITLTGFPYGYMGMIRKVYKAALKHFNQRDIFELEVKNIDKAEVRRLNKKTRDVDDVTDVLSYPNLFLKPGDLPTLKSKFAYYDTDPESGRVILGSIAICCHRMCEQAREFAHSEERECAYLFLHGLLHLFGYTHDTDENTAKMREVEESVLASVGLERD